LHYIFIALHVREKISREMAYVIVKPKTRANVTFVELVFGRYCKPAEFENGFLWIV